MSDGFEQNRRLVVYGRESCSQSRMLRNLLDNESIEYEWRDIVFGEPHYQGELRAITGSNLSVPTVVFADGSILIEPWNHEVLKRCRGHNKSIFEKFLALLKKHH